MPDSPGTEAGMIALPAAALQAPPAIVSQFCGAVARGLKSERMRLSDYLKSAWPILEPNAVRVHNWHDDLMAEYLEAVSAGQIKRLIFNICPRSGKSYTATIGWPTWEWTEAPYLRYMFGSYSASLSTKHSKDRRDIIESDWYQARWGHLVRLAHDQNEKNQYENTARGVMVATSVGGTATGKGGNRIVVDDPQNPEEAASKTALEAAAHFYDQTLSTRLNDPKRDAIVLVMQRLHHRDLTGHILAKEHGWEHVKIPSEATRRIVFVYPRSPGKIKVMEPGEVLNPSRMDRPELANAKLTLGTRGYTAQHLQETTADEGNLLQRKWWGYFKVLPHVIRSIWFYDTAMEEGEENDFTVGLRLNLCGDGIYIDRMVRDRLQYPDLKRTAKTEWDARPAHQLVIENKVSGMSLQQDLKKTTGMPVIAFKTVRDKVYCVNQASPYVEAGRVKLLDGAPWVADFIEECAGFPNADHDDIPDAAAKGIMYLTSGPGRAAGALSGGNLFTQGQQPRADWM